MRRVGCDEPHIGAAWGALACPATFASANASATGGYFDAAGFVGRTLGMTSPSPETNDL